LIAAEKTNYPVAVICRVLHVSRTGFHNWERRAPSDRALTDAFLTEKIRQIFDASNAVAETFFATLKKELVNRRTWPDRLELQSAAFEYIEAFYNRQRRHSTLGMLSPVAYEQLRLSPLGS
jgi:transposase InsO family protein